MKDNGYIKADRRCMKKDKKPCPECGHLFAIGGPMSWHRKTVHGVPTKRDNTEFVQTGRANNSAREAFENKYGKVEEQRQSLSEKIKALSECKVDESVPTPTRSVITAHVNSAQQVNAYKDGQTVFMQCPACKSTYITTKEKIFCPRDGAGLALVVAERL